MPYHDGSANGLSFGFKNQWIDKQRTGVVTKPIPKSLDVIFKEVEQDMYKGLHLDFDYTLQSWAEQGVMLLNSSLTVERSNPQSHLDIGWQRFVKIVLWELFKEPSPKVYILWGQEAQKLFQEVVDKIGSPDKSLILKAKHPAADLYARDQFGQVAPNYPNTFSGCKHFSQANSFLLKNKRKPIIW